MNWHRLHLLALFILVPLWLGAAGCSGDDPTPSVCTPNQSSPCFCESGSEGVQDCRADGTGFSPCDCRGSRDVGGGDACEGAECDELDLGSDPIDEPDSAIADTSNDAADTALPDVESDAEPDSSPDAEPDVVPDTEPDTPPPVVALGGDCETSGECETGICLGIAVAGVEHAVCTEPCCHEEECPLGFGCLRLGAGRWCLPSRIYPAGYTFLGRTGASCGAGGNACQSGICESRNDLCRGTCCTDTDCGAAPCHWSVTGSTQSLFCDPLAILNGTGRTGDACFAESDCRNGICVPSPRGGFQCADPCCTPAQCTFDTTCGFIQGLGGSLARACIPQPPGGLGDGLPCSDDGESCSGGHCVDGECRTVCCLDSQCDPAEACRPGRTPDGVVGTFCY